MRSACIDRIVDRLIHRRINRQVEKKNQTPVILGHRGIRKETVPENTIAAFREALHRGACGIEIDVESTLDKKLIVVNRWYLKSQFGFFPWERTLETIQSNSKTKGVEIPTFSQSCEFIKHNKNTIFNVEIKSSDSFVCHTARKAVDIIKRYGIDDRVIISSFDINTLLTTRFFHRTIETAYLFRKVDRVVHLEDRETWRYKINSWINRTGIKGFLIGVDTLHPEISLFPANSSDRETMWMKAARWKGKRVNAWTVDTQADVAKAMGAGVEIIISDSVNGWR